MRLVEKFYVYQKERFPFAVLIFTTFAVVLSSAAVSIPEGSSLFSLKKNIIVATLTCLLFMFSIRVFDDHKDKKFDKKYHKDRPVQRGLISIKELNRINTVSLLLQGIINFLASIYAFTFWILALVYSLIARAEFFIKRYIRKRFILYNILNLLQLFFLQVYIYALIEPGFSMKDPILTIHFVFVLANAAILEIARKLKTKDEENLGKDTYSARYGIRGASIIYAIVFLLTYLLFIIMYSQISSSTTILLLSLISLLVIAGSTINYYYNKSKTSTKIVEGTAILFYLAMHLLLAGAAGL